MTNSVCPFSINTSAPLHRRLRPRPTPTLDNLISLSLSPLLSLSRVTERRGITLRGEHPLRWRTAVGVLPDRRGGKINRCRLSRRSLYPQSVQVMSRPPLSVGCTSCASVCVWMSVCLKPTLKEYALTLFPCILELFYSRP